VSIPAQAAVFLFEQGGYTDGATASGQFTGMDLDFDGAINSLMGEVTDFKVTFSGNSVVNAFTLTTADLIGLYYSPAKFQILTASSPQFLLNSDNGPCAPLCSAIIAASGIDFTVQVPSISAVPEPATWALMILGFGLVGAAMRRRRTLTVRYA